MSQAVLEKILEGKIIAIVRGIPSTKIVGLAQALEKGGVNCIEVTFDQSSEEKAKDTLAAIRAIKDAGGQGLCGRRDRDERGSGASGRGGRRGVYDLSQCERGGHS